jgi:amino acid adenylation domain-containing protein
VSAVGDSGPVAAKRQRLAELLLAKKRAGETGVERITRRRGPGPAPLSFAQQRLWFLDKLVPDSPFYNVASALRIPAALDLAAMRHSFNEIVRRHEVLRTSFAEIASRPVQVVAPALEVPLPLIDLSGLDAARRDQEVLRLATEDAQKPFDLRHGPLIRTTVLRLGAADHVLLVNLHHIVADGWSIGVLVDEFYALYAAALAGEPSPLPPLAIQYGDFAAWQQRRLRDGGLSKQLAYWAAKLSALPTLELPTDHPRRKVQGFEGETLYVTLPQPLAQRLRAFSRREGVTLFTTLFAAFNALLARYAGQDEIVIGEPVANRNRVELEPLIGFFVNSLVLRTDVSGDPSFRELLRRSREVLLEADANQDVPFEVLVERLRPERTMGRNPLFQVSLQFFAGAKAQDAQATVPAEAIHVEKGTASLDLAFDLIESADGILARVEYSTELFRRDTVLRMIGHYRNLLDAFADDPGLALSAAPMLDAAERQAIVDGWNSPPPPKPFVHVAEMLRARTAAAPGRTAIEAGDERISYGALGAASSALARDLAARGVGPEKIVALLFERSPALVIAMSAVWEAGGAVLPLDPASPEERARFVITDARPCLVLTAPQHAARAEGWGVPVRVVDGQPGAVADDIAPQAPAPHARARRNGARRGAAVTASTHAPAAPASGPENLAYVIYTSGSSGLPKGVMVEHGALARHLAFMQAELPLSAADRTLLKYAVSFDVALLEVLSPLVAGATLVIFPGDGRFDVTALAELIRSRGITTVDLVPAMLAALLDDDAFLDSPALRRVICGGEAMPAPLLARLRARLPVEFVNMYGPTEATISATLWRDDGSAAEPVPIGRPGAPYSAYVLDRWLNPLPVGTPGELCLGGPCLARGYLGRPELTRERFVPDPFSPAPGARLYRTGDRARFRADGTLEFLGRLDDQVKLRGHRIELGDIDATLATSPLVRASAVGVREDSGRPELIAYVVPTAGEPEFWPSIGEYFVYDELMYHIMTSDVVRMRAYRAAIARAVRGKTAVDLGTGADLALARLCVEAGARHVYAIEMDDAACERARRLAESPELAGRITVLQGDSRAIALPEPVDVCVSELIGTIGSSEGAIAVLNDARRFLRPQGEMIPHRCITRIAAVSLPESLRRQPAFGEIAGYYAEKVFASLGRRFDIRVCVKNLPSCCIVSDTGVMEDLAFDRVIAAEETRELRLTLAHDATVDGLIAWVSLNPGPDELIDVLTSECSWLPVFLPVFAEPLSLAAGDTISFACSRLAEPGEMTPDYFVRGVVACGNGRRRHFSWESRRNETACGATPFYRALHGAPPPRRAPAAGIDAARVAAWQGIYDQLYAGEAQDGFFDITGWNSSYTGTPLSAAEMREQVEATVARIARLGGRRILEIGCGTGLLLLRLAPAAERYVGTDFSHPALARLAPQLAARGLDRVELWQRAADDFGGIAPGSFDLVVLNSVAQYFPGVDYLVAVLTEALRALAPGGAVFLGDLRSLPQLPALAAGIELVRDAATTVGELRERVERRQRGEQEFLIDPALFPVLARRLGGSVAIELKRGVHHNELTRFRYDVVLRPQPTTAPALSEQPFAALGSLPALRRFLHEARAPVVVRDVPNARLTGEWALVERLARADAAAPVADLLAPPPSPDGIEPEDLYALADALDCDIAIGFAASGRPQACDVIAVRRAPGAGPSFLPLPLPDADPRPLAAYVNALAEPSRRLALSDALRQHLRERLPDYMIPATFVWLEALPLTPHGKLNRRALPAPDPERNDPGRAYAPPQTPLERQIAAVWSEVLGITGFGIDANFFNVGGHSLLATQVVSRLSDQINLDIPLRLMFEQPTIRGFAAAAAALKAEGGARTVPPVIARRPADTATDLAGLSDQEVDLMLARLLSEGAS